MPSGYLFYEETTECVDWRRACDKSRVRSTRALGDEEAPVRGYRVKTAVKKTTQVLLDTYSGRVTTFAGTVGVAQVAVADNV